jgi:hypothetical protein
MITKNGENKTDNLILLLKMNYLYIGFYRDGQMAQNMSISWSLWFKF